MLLETLLDNLELKVDPFATCRLADGWRLRLPCNDWVTFHFILKGEGALRLGSGKLLPLVPSSLAIMPPMVDHAIQCGVVSHETGIEGQGDSQAALCEFVAGPVNELCMTVACGRLLVSYAGGTGLFEYLREAIVLDFTDLPRMGGIFESLVEEYRGAGPGHVAMMSALMNQCLIHVLRRLSQEADGSLPWLSALDDPRLARVIEAMLDHPENPHTLDGLAVMASMSRSTFVRHFEKSFRRTPMDYLRDIRLRRASRLLRIDGMSVDSIASKVGFTSRSHFSHAFHSQYGCSPLEFRKQQHTANATNNRQDTPI